MRKYIGRSKVELAGGKPHTNRHRFYKQLYKQFYRSRKHITMCTVYGEIYLVKWLLYMYSERRREHGLRIG